MRLNQDQQAKQMQNMNNYSPEMYKSHNGNHFQNDNGMNMTQPDQQNRMYASNPNFNT